MRVAIDIRRINEFGVGTYTRNAIRTLARLDHDNEYFLIGIPGKLGDIEPLPPNFITVPAQPNEFSLTSYLELHRILPTTRCDLLHVPHLFWKPQAIPCPYVVTVHDSARPHVPREQPFLASSARCTSSSPSGCCITPRASLRCRISRRPTRCGCSMCRAEKIEVIYNAIDDRFRQGHASDAEREFIAERYQVNYPFLLYAGRISPHKNVVRIIEAFAALKAELNKEGQYDDLKLIIIGDEVSKHPDLRRAVHQKPRAERCALPRLRAHRRAAHLLRSGQNLRLPLAV